MNAIEKLRTWLEKARPPRKEGEVVHTVVGRQPWRCELRDGRWEFTKEGWQHGR